jgi:hypothetical protein
MTKTSKLQKEKDIEILLEAALYMLLVTGSTPDNRQHLGINKEGTADRHINAMDCFLMFHRSSIDTIFRGDNAIYEDT